MFWSEMGYERRGQRLREEDQEDQVMFSLFLQLGMTAILLLFLFFVFTIASLLMCPYILSPECAS